MRVAQEALANVRRHARAERVALTLTYLDDEILLDVRDDGVGFEPGPAPRDRNGLRHGGFGLTAMRERLQERGGTLTIETAPGAGTTVVAALPAPCTGSANGEEHPDAPTGKNSSAR